MRKMFFAIFFVVIVIIASFYTTISNASSSVNLDDNAVFEISTAKDLYEIAEPENLGKNFLLMNDIDLAEDFSWQANVPDYENGFLPINAINNFGKF